MIISVCLCVISFDLSVSYNIYMVTIWKFPNRVPILRYFKHPLMGSMKPLHLLGYPLCTVAPLHLSVGFPRWSRGGGESIWSRIQADIASCAYFFSEKFAGVNEEWQKKENQTEHQVQGYDISWESKNQIKQLLYFQGCFRANLHIKKHPEIMKLDHKKRKV